MDTGSSSVFKLLLTLAVFSPLSAQAFSSEVEFFQVYGGASSLDGGTEIARDDFDDSLLSSAWTPIGTVVEDSATLTLSDVGVPLILPPWATGSQSLVSIEAPAVVSAGEIRSFESAWLAPVFGTGDFLSMRIAGVNGSSGHTHSVSVSVGNRSSTGAALLGPGALPGLHLTLFNSSFDGATTTLHNLQSIALTAGQLTGGIGIGLVYDPINETLSTGIVVDGGATFVPLTPIAFAADNLAGSPRVELFAGNIVPEPGTGLMLGLGLACVGLGRRRGKTLLR